MPIFVKQLPRLMLCAMLVTAAGGCQLAALLDKVVEPTEPAKYVPEHDNMLIIVEDYQNPALMEVAAEHMGRLVAEEMIAHKVAPVVNPDRLHDYRLEHKDEYRKMRIPVIGTELGARQVLYADITEFTVQTASGTDVRRGHAEARVKIVDARTGQTRWPRDATAAGYPVVVDMPFGTDTQNVTDAKMRRMMGLELATGIAKLFYISALKDQDPSPKYPESDLQ